MVDSTSWLDVEVVGLAVLSVVLMLALVVGRVVAGRGVVVVVVVVVVGVVVVVVGVVVVVVKVELDAKGKGCSCTEDPHCTITFCAADPVFIRAVTHNTTNMM